MVSNIRRYISLAVTVVIVIAALKFISWLPDVIQEDTLREYESVGAVRSRLNIKDIFIPSYFPQNIKWPPSEIVAQRKPYIAIMMGFKDRESGERILIIHQSASGDFIPVQGIGFDRIREMTEHQINSKVARLEVGLCGSNDPCSSISWLEGQYRIKITMKSTPFELIKIAESISDR